MAFSEHQALKGWAPFESGFSEHLGAKTRIGFSCDLEVYYFSKYIFIFPFSCFCISLCYGVMFLTLFRPSLFIISTNFLMQESIQKSCPKERFLKNIFWKLDQYELTH